MLLLFSLLSFLFSLLLLFLFIKNLIIISRKCRKEHILFDKIRKGEYSMTG